MANSTCLPVFSERCCLSDATERANNAQRGQMHKGNDCTGGCWERESSKNVVLQITEEKTGECSKPATVWSYKRKKGGE